jgi:hypothetical protein
MNSRRKIIALLAMGLVLALPLAVKAEDRVKEQLQRENEELKKLIEEQRVLLKALADIQDLKVRMTAVEKLTAAQDQYIKQTIAAEQKRVSMFPPQSGTIRLENRLSVPATIIVNETPYRLEPYQVREIVSVPAGTFTFSVLVDGDGVIQPIMQPRTTRTLLPNAVYKIFTYLP